MKESAVVGADGGVFNDQRAGRKRGRDIGVAQAALYPLISLSGSGGFESGSLGKLLLASSGFWSIGDRGYSPFQGGTNIFSFRDSLDLIRHKHFGAAAASSGGN